MNFASDDMLSCNGHAKSSPPAFKAALLSRIKAILIESQILRMSSDDKVF